MTIKPPAKKKQRKPRKKKNTSSDEDLQFLDTIIAENKKQEVQIDSAFVLRCTYCQPTVRFEDLASLKEHMTMSHLSSVIFCEQSAEVQEKTLKHHRNFYNSTEIYKEEVAYKLCKCKNIPTMTTRMALYIHSIEANHYPLVACSVCEVLMEREDSKEHSDSSCNPVQEGGYFLQAMQAIEREKA